MMSQKQIEHYTHKLKMHILVKLARYVLGSGELNFTTNQIAGGMFFFLAFTWNTNTMKYVIYDFYVQFRDKIKHNNNKKR